MAKRHGKFIGPLILDREFYDRLAQQARAAERDDLQQARYLIKQALKTAAPDAAESAAASEVPA